MSIVRTPLFFGRDGRSLFGWLHAPAESQHRLGVVVCPPLGHEGIHAHRSVRHLADAIAAAGMTALRFDYDGTGDSAGSDEDPGRVAAWLASVHDAMAMLRESPHCERIGLAGIRFGATMAALAAAQSSVACLALWAPVFRGRAYVREMKALFLTSGRPSTGLLEPGGFVIAEETERDIAKIELGDVVPQAERVLVAVRDDLPQEPPAARWGTHVEQKALPGHTEMFLPPHHAVVPTTAIGEIVQWLASN